jgi:hypothetical protein
MGFECQYLAKVNFYKIKYKSAKNGIQPFLLTLIKLVEKIFVPIEIMIMKAKKYLYSKKQKLII